MHVHYNLYRCCNLVRYMRLFWCIIPCIYFSSYSIKVIHFVIFCQFCVFSCSCRIHGLIEMSAVLVTVNSPCMLAHCMPQARTINCITHYNVWQNNHRVIVIIKWFTSNCCVGPVDKAPNSQLKGRRFEFLLGLIWPVGEPPAS